MPPIYEFIEKFFSQIEERKRDKNNREINKKSLFTSKITAIGTVLLFIATVAMVIVMYMDYKAKNMPLFQISDFRISNGNISHQVTKSGPGIAEQTWHSIIIIIKDNKPEQLYPQHTDNNPYNYSGDPNTEEFRYSLSATTSIKEQDIDKIFIVLRYRTSFKKNNVFYAGFKKIAKDFIPITEAEHKNYSKIIQKLSSKN